MQGKLIIFSAPSGSGKSTIINYLLQQNLNLAFSISATSRAPRGNERNGVEYYFMSPEEFKTKISNNEFLEYEEVYADKFYGTLKCEVERLVAKGKNVVFDVDVVGGINIKKFDKLYSKSGFIRDLAFKKLFIDNYDLYNNNELGQELLRRMEKMMENIDSIFYYDKVEFAKTVGEEIGFSKGKSIGFNNGKNETIKNKNGYI